MAGQAQKDTTRVAWSDKRQVWEVRWTEQHNGDYRSRAISTGIKDPSGKFEAEVFAAEFKNQSAAIDEVIEEPRINEIIDRYVTDVIARRGQTKNAKYMFNDIRKAFGAQRLSAMTSQDFVDYQIDCAGKHKTITILTRLKRLRTAILHAHKVGLIDKNIDPHIPFPAQQQGRIVFLDEQQEAEVHAFACGLSIGRQHLHPVTLFTCLGLDTGARAMAMMMLTWDRINFNAETIDYREPGMVVSRKRRAVVPINNRLRPVLQRAYKERKGNKVFAHPSVLEKEYRAFIRSTPYAWATAHVLRHTFASLSLNAGVDIVQVAELLGDTPETVLKTYAHTSRRWLHESVNTRHQY
jgi:integrase